jgi:hypothetical protein
LLGNQTKRRRVAPAARGGIPVESRIPASERTSQKLSELLTEGVSPRSGRAMGDNQIDFQANEIGGQTW